MAIRKCRWLNSSRKKSPNFFFFIISRNRSILVCHLTVIVIFMFSVNPMLLVLILDTQYTMKVKIKVTGFLWKKIYIFKYFLCFQLSNLHVLRNGKFLRSKSKDEWIYDFGILARYNKKAANQRTILCKNSNSAILWQTRASLASNIQE